MNRRWLVVVASGLVSLAGGTPEGAAAERDAGQGFVLTGPITVRLEEVPAFGKEEASGRVQYRYPRGPATRCEPTPSKEVKAYPKLNSKRPLFGALKFDANPSEPASGTAYYFVLDEAVAAEKTPEAGDGSAGAKPSTEAEKTPAKTAESRPTTPKTLDQAVPATPRLFDPFGRQAIKQTYDLLYFDRNGDLDLTNDGVIRLTDKPVFEAMPAGQMRGLSGEFELALDFGPDLGKRPFPIAVTVYAYAAASGRAFLQDTVAPGNPAAGGRTAMISFQPKSVRRGTLRLGEEQYVAWLSQATLITGRYDRPSTRLELMRVDRPTSAMRLQPNPLGQIHWVGEQLVSISTTPLGDSLTIEPYRGETGVLEIGPGGRAITDLGLSGTLASRTGTTMLGGGLGSYSLPAVLPRRYTLPVGDYGLPSLTAQYGRLRFSGRTATVSTAAADASSVKPPLFPIQIRKDARHVLEFPGKPEVVFSSPPKEQAFHPGDNVPVRAMLTEPWQRFQITGLWDLTRKEKEVTYRREGGDIVVPQYARLDPKIAIKNAAGRVVAEGTMPFG